MWYCLLTSLKKIKKKRRGYTVAGRHPSIDFVDGYTLEVFNAPGHSFAVVTVFENDIAALNEAEIFTVRSMEADPR